LTGDLVLGSNQAVSLNLVFGAKALPTSGGTSFGIEPSVLVLIEAELVFAISDCTGDSRKPWSLHGNE